MVYRKTSHGGTKVRGKGLGELLETPLSYHQPRQKCMPEALLHGEEIRPIAPWNNGGSGYGFLTYAHRFGAYISAIMTLAMMSLGAMVHQTVLSIWHSVWPIITSLLLRSCNHHNTACAGIIGKFN